MHFMNILKGSSERNDPEHSSFPSRMLDLITHQTWNIGQELCDLIDIDANLTNPSRWGTCYEIAVASNDGAAALELECCAIAFGVLSLSCNFSRRVLSIIGTFPYQLAWLGASPPDVKCFRRQLVARKLLLVSNIQDSIAV